MQLMTKNSPMQKKRRAFLCRYWNNNAIIQKIHPGEGILDIKNKRISRRGNAFPVFFCSLMKLSYGEVFWDHFKKGKSDELRNPLFMLQPCRETKK